MPIDSVQGSQALPQQQQVHASTQQLIDSAQKGFDMVKEGSGYYMTTTAQTSAQDGPYKVKVDKDFAEAVLAFQKTGGRISIAEAIKLVDTIKDGQNKYGDGEKAVVKVLLAACDDRCTVKLAGQELELTTPAETQLKRDLSAWWGSLAHR